MELKSNQPSKKMIDCAAGVSDAPICARSHWYFAELSCGDFDLLSVDGPLEDFIVDYDDVLRWSLSVLERSPSARQMLDEVCAKDWAVSFEDLRGGDYYIDVEQKLLVLNHNALDPAALGASLYFRNIVLVNLTKALRDIWQEKRHGGFERHYAPEHILFMERLRSADLDVLSILTAWELRSENYTDLWRHLIGSDIGDMAMMYSGHMDRDPSSAYNGQALQAVFKQWYRDAGRIKACDHDALEYMDEILAVSDDVNPFGKRRPGKMNIEMLSCLPDRTAYLQGQGSEILADPLYIAVDEPINQSHLMHIMYDLEAVVVEDVAFRDEDLARKIFPVEG